MKGRKITCGGVLGSCIQETRYCDGVTGYAQVKLKIESYKQSSHWRLQGLRKQDWLSLVDASLIYQNLSLVSWYFCY